jgi:hypothetical protein
MIDTRIPYPYNDYTGWICRMNLSSRNTPQSQKPHQYDNPRRRAHPLRRIFVFVTINLL